MKVLVDADFLVALAKEDDFNHREAILKTRVLKEAVIFITPFTISEAVTVLSYKVSQAAAAKFLKSARAENFIELPLNQELAREADKLFFLQKKKGTSWIDCFNAAAAKLYEVDVIASFDKFYKRLGIRLI